MNADFGKYSAHVHDVTIMSNQNVIKSGWSYMSILANDFEVKKSDLSRKCLEVRLNETEKKLANTVFNDWNQRKISYNIDECKNQKTLKQK